MDKPISDLSGDLRGMATKILDKVKSILPEVVAIEGLRFFEKSWDDQGFTNNNLVKWKKRKEPKYGKKRWGRKNAGRAILVSHQSDTEGTHLKDSLREEHNEKEVIFSTDKVYAQVHNEGGKAGRGKGFIMEKRQYMGESKVLDDKIADKLDREIEKLFKSL
jgi:phage gpG-like protein